MLMHLAARLSTYSAAQYVLYVAELALGPRPLSLRCHFGSLVEVSAALVLCADLPRRLKLLDALVRTAAQGPF